MGEDQMKGARVSDRYEALAPVSKGGEVMHAIRRADGDEIGDYTFVIASGDDPWKAVDGYEDDEEAVEYELVRMDLTVVETRTLGGPLGEPCAAWDGFILPGRTTWQVYVPESGNADTWPLTRASIAWADSEEDAERIVNDLPTFFYIQQFGSNVTMVEKSSLVIEAKASDGYTGPCSRCKHALADHRGEEAHTAQERDQ